MTAAPRCECSDLSTHDFRSADDLIYALRLAAAEVERGVLARIEEPQAPRAGEREALYSALDAGALPGNVAYRFRCQVCGERFALLGDTQSGAGSWTREGP